MRNCGLDILRLVAVLLVLGRHVFICPPETSSWGHIISIVIKRGGWVGVDLFFVISGFLVSGLIFREFLRKENVDVRSFLIRRGLKIYPSFWLLLIFTVTFTLIMGQPLGKRHLLGELTFTQNYLGGLWSHTWSLAVEEHFYILLAIVTYYLIKFFPMKIRFFDFIPRLFLVMAVGCLVARILTARYIPFSYETHFFASHLRMDSLMFGVLLAWLWYYHDLETTLRKIPVLILIILGIICFIPPFIFEIGENAWLRIYGPIFLYLGSGCFLAAFIQLRQTDNKILQMLAVMGGCSYSIYLWHVPVNFWGTTWIFGELSSINYYWYLGWYIVGSMIIGMILSKFVEYPILALRDRMFPSESTCSQALKI